MLGSNAIGTAMENNEIFRAMYLLANLPQIENQIPSKGYFFSYYVGILFRLSVLLHAKKITCKVGS